jgi:hypothetical protein
MPLQSTHKRSYELKAFHKFPSYSLSLSLSLSANEGNREDPIENHGGDNSERSKAASQQQQKLIIIGRRCHTSCNHGESRR